MGNGVVGNGVVGRDGLDKQQSSLNNLKTYTQGTDKDRHPMDMAREERERERERGERERERERESSIHIPYKHKITLCLLYNQPINNSSQQHSEYKPGSAEKEA